MSSLFSTPRRILFGNYEADLRSGELLKNGKRVRLQAQPFQLLVMLLERPGELVKREEICQKLWSGDTFVDFDRSWESFARRQGCFEMCTLAGSVVAIMIVRMREAKEKKEEDIQDRRSKIQG